MDPVIKAKSFIKGASAVQGSASGRISIEHPTAVARLVWQVTLDETATAAALLHDVMSYTRISTEALTEEFGCAIAKLVLETSTVSRARDGSRAYRNAMDRAHVAKASPTGLTIKVADLIDSTMAELARNPDKGQEALEDLRAFLPVLPQADPTLLRAAHCLMEAYAVPMAA